MGRKRKISGGGGGGDAGATAAKASKPFAEGAEVELRYDDDGFHGAWFEAVVVQPLPGRRLSYSVVHSSLVADEDPSLRLTEIIPASHIRPRPPPAAAPFSLHHLVDAFHNGAWWPGIVSAVRSPALYTVCIPTSREEFDFPSAAVRPRSHWSGLRWSFPAAQEEVGGAKYKAGAEVEISGDREMYAAVWVPGTVEKVISNKVFVVEYLKVGIDLVKEIVDVQYIRPRPPRSVRKEKLKPLDLAEVFCCGGWMQGEVLRILDESRYVVRMEYPREVEREVHCSEVRARRRLIGAVWHSMSKKKRGRSSSLVGRKPSIPLSVSIPSSSVNSEATKQPLQNEIYSVCKKGEGSNLEDHEVVAHSCKVLKKGGSSDQLRIELAPGTPIMAKEIAAANPDLENPSNDLIVSSPFMLSGLPQNPLFGGIWNEQTLPTFRSRTELLGSDGASKFKGTKQQIRTPNLNNSQAGHLSSDFPVAIEINNCKGVQRTWLSTKQRTNKLAIRGSQGPGGVPCIDVKKHAKEGVSKKKRGPCKNRSINHMMVQIEGMQVQQSYGSSFPVVECEERREDDDDNASSQPDTGAMFNDIQPLCLQVMGCENLASIIDYDGDSPEDNVLRAQINEQEAITAARPSTTKKESSTKDNASANDLVTPSTNFPLNVISPGRQEVINISNGLSDKGNKPENQGLLAPFKKSCLTSSYSSTGVEDISCYADGFNAGGNESENLALVTPSMNLIWSPPKKVQDISCDSDGLNAGGNEGMDPSVVTHFMNLIWSPSKRVNNGEGALVEPSTPPSPSVKATLPFRKSSFLWASIESMEVFHQMPQQPHFRPLEQYSMVFREGMAIGLMVTFASLATNASKFRISDSRGTFEEKLKVLVPLEDNGFDVVRLRSRLEKLLEIRDTQCHSLGQKATLREHILEKENEKDRLEALAVEFEKTIRKMEQDLAFLSEKRDLSVEQRKCCESEIARLHKDAAAVEEDYLSADKHFSNLVASSWQ